METTGSGRRMLTAKPRRGGAFSDSPISQKERKNQSKKGDNYIKPENPIIQEC